VRSGHTGTVRDEWVCGWRHALSTTRLEPALGVLQDKRTVRIISAADTARRGEN
jgi:hypothetical protein